MTVLHLGQGPFLPANLSLTEKRAWQLEQTTWIGIEEGSSGKATCLVGVLGFECVLERWTDDGPVSAGAVYVGALPGQPD